MTGLSNGLIRSRRLKMGRGRNVNIAVDDELSAEIRKAAKTGLSVAQLCERFELGKNAIRRHAIADFKPRVSEFNQQEIRRLRKQGLTYQELQERYGLSRYTVQAVCLRRYKW